MRVGTLTISARSGRRKRRATLGSTPNFRAAISNCCIAIALVALCHSSAAMLPLRIRYRKYSSGLAGRPTHLAPADQMIMQMKNALSCIRPGVDHHAKPAFADAVFTSEPSGNLKNLTDKLGILRFDVEHTADVLARNDQKVNRRSWSYVFERDHAFVLVNNVRFGFAADNRAEQTVAHCNLSPRGSSHNSRFSRWPPANARKSVPL